MMKSAVSCVVLLACVATLAAVVDAAQRGPCDIPSRFWCDDLETATKCRVVEQCRQHEWARADDKVRLTLFYESLCPDCKDYMKNQLYPYYANLSSIMDLELVPYGNAWEAEVDGWWVFICQHGEQECIGNLIETCTIHLVKDVDKHFPFLYCMEMSKEEPTEAAKTCHKKFPYVPLDDIFKCTKSPVGNELQHKMAVRTFSQQPNITGVPYLLVNDVYTPQIEHEAQYHLVSIICDTYKGAKKPPVCNN